MDALRDQITDALHSLDPRLLVYAIQILRLCIWLIVLSVIFAPLERLFALHPRRTFRRAILTDLGYYFLNSLATGVLLGVPVAVLAWGAHRLLPVQYISAVSGLPLWVRTIATVVVGEAGFYWGHRWCHESSLLWRFHAIHHSSEHLDFLVNTRAHPVDMVFTRVCGMVPLYLLGLASPVRGSSSLVPALLILFGTVWGFFIHANIRWRFGPLEWLVATPAFHHWHHTNDGPAYINKNYSSTLPILDRLFGTLYLPRDRQPASYGIDQPVSPILFGQLLGPFLFWRKDPSETTSEPSHTSPSSTPVVSSPQHPEATALTQPEV